jgi:alpha-1,6-mannosyltransferase
VSRCDGSREAAARVKLCSLTQSYAPAGGGVRTMLHAEQAWFRDRAGMSHVLIVPGARDTTTCDANLTIHTVASPRLPGSAGYRLLLRSGRVLRLLRDELPDVIEVHCAYNLPWTALLHRRRHGGIVSGFYMTDLPGAYVETPLKKRLGRAVAHGARALAERYVAALYRRCDVAVAISPVMRDRLVSMGVRAAHCVPLGVDLATFHPARRTEAVRARLGVRPGELLFVYAGRLDREKQPDIVIEAFARLPRAFGAVLAVIGDGPLRAPLAARAAAIGRVHVLPFEPERAALARLLASADVYVSAMAHETFGLSVVEAQACGLPVLGVRAGAMIDRVPELAEPIGFLVAPDSPAALSERILRTPREEWRRMGQRARERVAAEFSWSRTFETTQQIYRTALDDRVAREPVRT